MPREDVPGVEKGVKSAMESGVIAGFPMVDLTVSLTDGAYHEVDSSVMAFEIAARAAFREGIAKAGPVLLEPVMAVEANIPHHRHRARMPINAMVPLATMFGYVNTLRSLSQGRAQFTMSFDHYEPVPQMVAQEIQAKYA